MWVYADWLVIGRLLAVHVEGSITREALEEAAYSIRRQLDDAAPASGVIPVILDLSRGTLSAAARHLHLFAPLRTIASPHLGMIIVILAGDDDPVTQVVTAVLAQTFHARLRFVGTRDAALRLVATLYPTLPAPDAGERLA